MRLFRLLRRLLLYQRRRSWEQKRRAIAKAARRFGTSVKRAPRRRSYPRNNNVPSPEPCREWGLSRKYLIRAIGSRTNHRHGYLGGAFRFSVLGRFFSGGVAMNGQKLVCSSKMLPQELWVESARVCGEDQSRQQTGDSQAWFCDAGVSPLARSSGSLDHKILGSRRSKIDRGIP